MHARVSEVILLNMNTDPIAGVVVKQRQEIPPVLGRISDIHGFRQVASFLSPSSSKGSELFLYDDAIMVFSATKLLISYPRGLPACRGLTVHRPTGRRHTRQVEPTPCAHVQDPHT